jgi:hypothetical protein
VFENQIRESILLATLCDEFTLHSRIDRESLMKKILPRAENKRGHACEEGG